MAFPTYSDSVDVAQLQAAVTEEMKKHTKDGSVTITPSAANTPTSQNVTFATPFASTPNVALTIGAGTTGTLELTCWVSNVTTTGFTAWIRRGNTSATLMHWVASDLGNV